jgi:hypothetical protein
MSVMPSAPVCSPTALLDRRSSLGDRRYSVWNVALKRRMLLKPDAKATSVIGMVVSTMSCFAKSTRRV